MNKLGWMQSGLLLLVGLVLLTGCVAQTSNIPLQTSEPGGFFTTAKGWVVRIDRSGTWFELKLKKGGDNLTFSYDPTTALLNFKDMIEITKEQPLEVTYIPGGVPVNRAISIQKLPFDGCQ